MKCQTCNGKTTAMSNSLGIYCPKCQSAWFDRGELEKIIGRSKTTRRERKKKKRKQRQTAMSRLVAPKREKRKNSQDEFRDL